MKTELIINFAENTPLTLIKGQSPEPEAQTEHIWYSESVHTHLKFLLKDKSKVRGDFWYDFH